VSKIILIYPPIAQPFSPSLAIAELASVLRTAGHTPITFDYNIRTYVDLFTNVYINESLPKFEEDLKRIEKKSALLGTDLLYYSRVCKVLIRGPMLAERIETALQEIGQLSNYQFDRKNQEALKDAWAIYDATYDLIFKTLDHSIYKDAYCFLNEQSILNAIDRPQLTPFSELFERYTCEIKNLDPDAVCINMTFPEQGIPAFLLSSTLRKNVNCPVLIGGSLPNLLSKELSRYPALFDYVDGICVGDGELTVLGLADGENVENLPNILFRNSKRKIVRNTPKSWDIRNSKAPLFDNNTLSQLFTPEPVIPYQTARSCYYGKCNFCNYTAINPKLKERSFEQVAADLETLTQQHNTDLISFADDATAPHRLLGISKEIIKKELDILWWTCTRFDGNWNPEMLSVLEKAGCARLFFGCESATPRVQKVLAGKGFSLKKVQRVLGLLQNTRIHPHVSAIIGFPTETTEEARQTIDFMIGISQIPKITTRIHLFRLSKDSPFALSAEKNGGGTLGITEIKRSTLDTLAIQHAQYRTLSGMEKVKAISLIDKFEEYKKNHQGQSYGEYHTFEPLLWAKHHSRGIPTPIIDNKNGESVPLKGPLLSSAVTLREFVFSLIEAKTMSEMVLVTAEENLYSGDVDNLKDAIDAALKQVGPLSRNPQLAIYNVLTNTIGRIPAGCISTLKLMDGTHSIEALLEQWEKDRLGDLNDLERFIYILESMNMIVSEQSH